MTYTTSKGRTLTWGSNYGITTDTQYASSYTSETTFFSKGYAESESRTLSDYWWVPYECIQDPLDTDPESPNYNQFGGSVDPTEANGFCENEGYTLYVPRA